MSRLRDDGVTIPPCWERRHQLRCRDRMQVVRIAVVTLATATLLAAGGGVRAAGSHSLAAVEPAVRHPYAVVVDPRGRVFVADGAARRIVLVSPRTGRRSVRATGFDEPTGLAATRNALYVADFHAARISGSGRIARVPVPGGLDRPHGVVFARSGDILVAEDSRRVRRIDPATGRERSSSTASTRTGSPSPATGLCSSPAAARSAAAFAGSSPAGSRGSCSKAPTSATSPFSRTAT